jgi:hypothetical protein
VSWFSWSSGVFSMNAFIYLTEGRISVGLLSLALALCMVSIAAARA